MRKMTLRTAAMIAMSSVLLTAFTGCQNGSGTSETGGTGTASQSAGLSADFDDTALVKEFTDALAPYQGTPQFSEAALGKVDAAAVLSGKKIAVIPYNPANMFSVNIAKNEQVVLEALGAEVIYYEPENSADGWTKALEYAVSQGCDIADFTGGADMTLFGPAIQAAEEAGTLVFDCHGADITDTFADSYTVGADYALSAKLQAYYALDYAEKNLGGWENLNMLVVECTGLLCDITVRKGWDYIDETYGFDGGAKFQYVTIASAEWDSKTESEVTSALVRDPSINFIGAYYDNQLIRVIPALKSTDRTDIPVISYNGSSNVLDYITTGEITMDIGESTRWMALHCIDCMIRALMKKDDDSVYVPNRDGYAMYFIDKNNIENCLNPDTHQADYDHDGVEDVYTKGYTDLWGFDISSIDFSSIN